MTERDNSDPSDDQIVQAAKAEQYDKIIETIANMDEGEIFLYGSTYNEQRVIRGEELHLMFCYHDEMHMAKEDYGQKAYELLDLLYRGAIDNKLDAVVLDAEWIARIKAIVDPDDSPAVTSGKPTLADNLAVTSETIDKAHDRSVEWLNDDNIEKMQSPEVHDRTQGEIIIYERFGRAVLGTASPAKMLAFIEQPASGPITGNDMSDYLVQAFDRGFAVECGFEAACFGWRLPTGEIIHQHST